MIAMLKNHLRPLPHGTFASSALLLLRLVAGVAFVLHGTGKIQNPFGWMPGGNIPGVFQFLAAISEFGGGIAWIIGLVTPVAALGIAFTMLVASGMHALVMHDPFVSTGGASFEPALLYFAVAVVLMGVGPGKFSLDWKIFGART